MAFTRDVHNDGQKKQHSLFFPSPAYRKTNLPFLDDPELTVNSLIRISALSS
jgi:hypothetical protein